MKNISILVGLCALLVGGVATAGVVKAPAGASSVMKCPACGMPMSTKKTAMFNVPVMVKATHKVYYCCPGCAAGKSAAAYYKAHKKPEQI